MSSLPSPAAAPAGAPTHQWDELARRLEDFLAAWEKGAPGGSSPPSIKSFLPADPPALRKMVLVELIKTDM